MANSNTPKIRFKGFTDDWEQRKLSEMTTYRNGRGHEDKQSDSGKYELINLNSVSIDGGLKPSGRFIDESNETLLVNDLVMVLSDVGHGDLLGRVAIIPENNRFVLNQRVALLRPNDSSYPRFLLACINAHQGYFKLNGAGSSQLNISKDVVEDFAPYVPEINEQKMIASYFDNIENLITLHQRKAKYIFIHSKSVTAHCFSENLTSVWEQRKLSDIYKDIGNAFVGTATPYYVDEGHFYLESNNIKDGQINHNTEVFINDEFYERQKDKWLHTGDMVMVQSGHVGHAAVIPEELDCSAAHALIMFRNLKVEIEPYFLNYQYQTTKSKKKIENITTGNTIKHILASEMQEFVVDVATYGEQEKIAGFFRNLDNLITLHQRKHFLNLVKGDIFYGF